jgi:hypothetical protein
LTEEVSPAFSTIEWCAFGADGAGPVCTTFDVVCEPLTPAASRPFARRRPVRPPVRMR